MPGQRKLNLPLIKSVVMFVLTLPVAVAGALTGIGTQIAVEPMVTFLLGFTPERCRGTAFAFSLCAALGAAIGAGSGRIHLDFLYGLALAVGATIGALLVARPAANPRLTHLRRFGQSLAIVLSVFVIHDATRQRFGGIEPLPFDYLALHPRTGSLLIGVAAGLLGSLLQIATGILLVPGLIYIAAFPISRAIGTAVIVVALASLIPALAHASRGTVDQRMGAWMSAAGAIGGFAGGALLSHTLASSNLPLVLFGLAAMFLSAWTLYRMSLTS